MNTTIIIGIIITAAIVVPIGWLIRAQGAGKRKLEKEIAALGNKSELNITEHESWNNKVIAIDRDGGKAFFAVFGNPSNQVQIAELKNFDRCYTVKNLLNSGSKYDNEVISNISIHFVPSGKGAQELVFPLYIDSVDLTLGNELQIAAEWVDKFNGAIRRLNHK